MHYMAIADTDIGISKDTNQDSILLKHARYGEKEVLLAIICDGMGGLSKGELASATVIREFARWFEEELPYELENLDMQIIGAEWALTAKDLNAKISSYGQKTGIELGTTFTCFLIVDDRYLIGHVGDTRIYHIDTTVRQLTKDQTYVAREIQRGTMTLEQAKTDKRRNVLLQCVGTSKPVEPDIIQGDCQAGIYMLCSDGFRHEITDVEIYQYLNPQKCGDRDAMRANARYLIEENKRRREKDNISVILIRAY